MNILILYNDFDGAYGSLEVFQQELIYSITEPDRVYISRSIGNTESICADVKIDFSMGIGEFYQFSGDIPIYEITKVPHYHWLIDNPLKMNIDFHSTLITYILINRDFIYNLGKCCNVPIYIPLGFNTLNASIGDKDYGIVFSGQIKNVSINKEDNIFQRSYGNRVRNFLDIYDCTHDVPFEKTFQEYFQEFSLNEKKSIFRYLNSYYRALKRKKVIQSINDYPIYILGDVFDEEVRRQRNVFLVGKVTYAEVWNIISKYMFSLNISPNFSDSIHDRIIRSICCGTIPVSEEGEWCRSILGESMKYYSCENLAEIESLLINYTKDEYKRRIFDLRDRIEQFRWGNIIQKIKEKFINNELQN